MTRVFPASLFGQTLLALLVGLVISHAAGSWIYSLDREQAVRAVGGFAAAQRMANLVRLVQDTPPEARPRIVTALSDPTFRVALSAQAPAMTSADGNADVADAIAGFLADQLSIGGAQRPLVSASPGGPMSAFGGLRPMMGRGPMMHGFGSFGPFGGFRDLQVAVPLTDGQWLSFTTALPQGGPAVSRQFLLSMALMAIILLAVSVWVVRRVTAPLASLSAAAEKLGNDLNALPMPEAGTVEMQQASRAFNNMQARLRALVENRTRILAAISHDLRTPLTLLRLRTETVEDVPERDRMLATIAEMDAMIAATLEYARDESIAEPRRRTDVTALLASVVDDMADLGLPVVMEPAQPIICDCQPAALKRALINLIDNAVKYGKRARTTISSANHLVEITIDDDGPGIPEAELERVFQPFYRVESSRSRETGGIGLGLAIALSTIQAHRGQLTISNRAEGGLRACVSLEG
ncbi:ATP-binding protein [Rhodopseudomonas sp. RCAM05734]|uniref:ATP-binding protein n=1 Tax=Rhodopseudomonas sp. RCAM05734 TaxID=3457549 RepID=UPI0040447A7E